MPHGFVNTCYPTEGREELEAVGLQPAFIIIQFNNHLIFPKPSSKSVENYGRFKLFSVTHPERREKLQFKVS